MKNFYAPFFCSIDCRKSLRTTVALLLLFVCLAPVTAQDTNEPNDAFGEATVLAFDDLSVDVDGTIDPAGDLDYFRIEIPRAGVVVMEITNVPATMYPSVVLYDEAQTSLKSASGSQATTLLLIDRVCEAGTYYVRVSDRFSSVVSPESYNLKVSLDVTDVYECNDVFADASPVELGDTVTATIRDEGDLDYYRIDVPRAGVVVAQVLNVPAGMYPAIELYDDSQTAQKSISGSQGTTTTLIDRVCSPGTYFLRVSDRFTSVTNPDTYRFAISLDTTDVYECNDVFADASPVELGDTAIATIRDEGDLDYYRIEVPRAGVVVAQVLNVPAGMYPAIELYDDSQTAQKSIGGSQGTTTTLVDRVCSPGTYFLRVSDRFTSVTSPDTYRFAISLDTTDTYECNDVFADASPVEFGDTLIATIRDEGDLDHYRIEVPRSGTVTARVQNVPSNMYPSIVMYTESQTSLGSIGGNQGVTTTLNEQICTPGIYYVRVSDRFSSVTGLDPYRLVIELDTSDVYECNNEFNLATRVALCDTISGSIFPSDDNDYFEIIAPADDTINLNFIGLQPEIRYRIFGYDATQTSLPLEQETTGGPISLFTQDSGSYYFQFVPQSASEFSQDPYSILFSTPAGCGPGDADTTSTSTNELLTEDAIRLYPNPVTDRFTVAYGQTLQGRSLDLRIYGVDGRELANYSDLRSGQSIDVSSLPTGVLMLRFRVEQEILTRRVIRQP